LIVTLMLMSLLAILALGMLSLSSVSLRGASLDSARATARANARLALTLAIGELQKNAGSDTRVTAPADILDSTNPPLTGVWRSWEGSDHEISGDFAGRPLRPAYEDKGKAASAGGRFLTWLVSGKNQGGEPGDAASLVKTTPSSTSVALLSSKSLATGDKREVHLEPVPVGDRGSMAWWVSGENQKALIPHPYDPEDDTPAGWSLLAKSHPTADPFPFHLEHLLEDATPARKIATRKTADLIAAADAEVLPHEFFHDLSTMSVGLLTNTATGGWRKDLSLLTENWGSQPKSGLPFFSLSPASDAQASIPTVQNVYPGGSILYPWAAYRGGNGSIPIYRHGPVSTWENLVDFATFYKGVSVSPNGRTTVATQSAAIDDRSPNGSFNFIHRVRVLPLIARMQWVFSHSAAPVGDGTQGLFEPRLLLTPVITMWNPYNVEIASPSAISFIIPKAMPAALKYTIGGTENPNYNSVMAGVNNKPSLGGGALRFRIDQTFTLIPGETRVFSPESETPVRDNATITMRPGYRSGGGHYYSVKGPNGESLQLPSSTTIKADAKFDTVENDLAQGVGIYLDMSVPNRRHLVYRMVYIPEVAEAVYPPLKNLASGTMAQCVSNPQPFLSTVFGARTASRTHLAAKGFVQSSPLVNYTAMGRKDEVESTIRRHYGGTAHPVNSPFDYSFVKHSPGGDSYLPNASDSTDRGYIVTGFNKADGLSRCVISELPLRPLASIAELTHWDLRYENPIPPYAINLIANSDASPLLPPDDVVNSVDSELTVNLQYDDSYCANHLLFDDWFLSSIAPDPGGFGVASHDQKKTYGDFLKGIQPLPNRAYRAIIQDRSVAVGQTGGASGLYDKHITPADSWKTIASRLEVEGMFNVNSTSVTAWRALLGHARNQRVPHISEAGAGWNLTLSEKSDHVLNRFSVAADTEAGTAGSSGAFPEATDFAGYRTVDGDFLDAMAEEIVFQIRERGPFLSLSEFVNRQLSSGDFASSGDRALSNGDRALAGTIQAALNELSKNSSTDPFKNLKALSSPSAAVPDRAAEAEYSFPEAAAGHSGYGMPGWTRQADILRPLAPILSARDDTFTLRAYGDARDRQGRVIARAVCAAVVQRTREFVDPGDTADLTTGPSLPVNQRFGRRFKIVSFRWLSPRKV
jgi:hypothetical protein